MLRCDAGNLRESAKAGASSPDSRDGEFDMTHRRYNRKVPRRALPFMTPLVAVAVFAPATAQAYVGPGAGLTAIGTVLALIAALIFALVGFIWYPVKRLLKRSSATAPAAKPERNPE
jgi:hypothetical protein